MHVAIFLCLSVVVTLLGVLGPDKIPNAVSYTLQIPPKLPKNDLLKTVMRVYGINAPESFAEASSDAGIPYLFMTLKDGRVARLKLLQNMSVSTYQISFIARTGRRSSLCDDYNLDKEEECGRPLGLCFHPAFGLLVADSYHGIKRISKTQAFMDPISENEMLIYEPELLVTPHQHVPIKFFNSLVMGNDNDTIYFTSSSEIYQLKDVFVMLADGRATGRVFRHSMKKNQTTQLLSGLGFANGIALVDEELLVSVTRDVEIIRYNVRTGTVLPFSSNLPCTPDNLVYIKKYNVVAVGCGVVRIGRISFLDVMASKPWLRRLLLRVFEITTIARWIPQFGMVLLIDDKSGKLKSTWNYEDSLVEFDISEVHYSTFSGVFFLGSFRNNWLGVLPASLDVLNALI